MCGLNLLCHRFGWGPKELRRIVVLNAWANRHAAEVLAEIADTFREMPQNSILDYDPSPPF